MLKKASLLLATFLLSSLAFADNWHKEYQLTGTPELNMRSGDVNIRIEPWEKNYISVDLTTTNWKIGQGAGELEITDYQRDNYIEVNIREHGTVHFGWSRSKRGDAVVRMPANAKLNIQTSDGHLSVSQMKGDMRLRTSDGRLEGRDLEGNLDASTSDGRLSVNGKFTSLRTHSSDGRTEVRVEPGSRMDTGWDLRTSDGGIRLELPKDFSANLDVHVGDGHLDLDIPVTVQGRFGSHDMRGKIGQGGALLTVRSSDGSVRISSL